MNKLTPTSSAEDSSTFQRVGEHLPTPDHLPSDAVRPSTREPHRNLEDSLVHISELLTCAAATAYEAGDSMVGSKRALAFSAMHLVEMAKAELDHSLEHLPLR